jgi:hypothetical protein
LQITFNEQDLMNCVIVFTTEQYNERLEDLEAELNHEDEKGIFAVVTVKNDRRMFQLSEQDMIDAVALYLDRQHNFDPNILTTELMFEPEKGISAVIDQKI